MDAVTGGTIQKPEYKDAGRAKQKKNGKKLLGRLPIDMLCRLLAETKRDSILKRELPQIT